MSANYLLASTEMGSAERFAGSGRGMELRLAFHLPSGWTGAVVYSQAGDDLFSVVDNADSELTRYLLGVSRGGQRGAVYAAAGAGLAFNTVTMAVEKPQSALDISGPGVYLEGQFGVRLWSHFRVVSTVRIIYWQGEDGLGNSGTEISTTAALGIAARF